MFSSFVSFIRARHSWFRIGGAFLVLLYGFTYAQNAGDSSSLVANMIEVVDFLFSIIAFILWPLVVLSGWLLSPDWTMGDFFWLRPYFREVWILVSNITYIIFALALLYMAIVQIFGGSESEYAFKKKLPDFIVGILIVPFTWMIVSFTLSFANQAVAAVLSIPMGAITKTLDDGSQENTSYWHKKILPRKFEFFTQEDGWVNTPSCSWEWSDCMSVSSFLAHNNAGPFFIMMIYAYDIFKIQNSEINRVQSFCLNQNQDPDQNTPSPWSQSYKNAKDCTKDLIGILRKYGLNLVLTVFFAILLVALCWVLLMRAIKLWIYIMLSPLFWLAYFTGKGWSESFNSWWGGGGGETGLTDELWFKQFFKLAMVPVLVSAVLAFGLLFVGVVRDSFQWTITSDEKYKDAATNLYCTDGTWFMVKYCITEYTSSTGSTFWSRLIIGTDITNYDNTTGESDYTITLDFGNAVTDMIGGTENWLATDGQGNIWLDSATGIVAGALWSVTDLFAHLILTIMALAFIWLGVRAAVSYDKVTEMAFAPFAKLGDSVTKFVAHSPSYIPLPHPAFKALTPTWIEYLSQALDRKIIEDKQNLGKSLGDILWGTFNDFKQSIDKFDQGTEKFQWVAQSFNKLQDKKSAQKDIQERLITAIEKSSDSTQQNTDVKKLLQELKTGKKDGSELRRILDGNDAGVAVLEKDIETKWVLSVAQDLGATQETQSNPFYGVQIENGNIKLGNTTIATKSPASGTTPLSYTVTGLSDEQKRHIGLNITAMENVSGLSSEDTTAKLQAILPGITLPSEPKEQKALLEALQKARIEP